MISEICTYALGNDILTGLITSIIYDFGKGAVINVNKSESDITKRIDLLIREKVPKEYIELSESAYMKDFLINPQVYDSLYNLVNLKALYIVNRIYMNKKLPIASREIEMYGYLSQNFIELYHKETVVNTISKKNVEEYLKAIVAITAEFLNQQIDFSNGIVTSIMSTSFYELGFPTYERVEKILDILERTNKCKIIETENNYESLRQEYMHQLKVNNSKAHIYLLDTFDFSQFYIPPTLVVRGNEEGYENNLTEISFFEMESKWDWKNIFNRRSIVYVTGGAGYGKSLFMKNLINNIEQLAIPSIEEYIIIYGELKSFYIDGSEIPLSMVKFLQLSIKNSTLMDESKITTGFVEYYLKRGRCIILLDALDEVEQFKRKELHEKVVNYFKNQNPNNKICITSRNRGFIPQSNIDCCEIMPLTEAEVRKYVDKIIALNRFDKKDKEPFITQTGKLIKNNFLNSFLVLSLLINIYKSEREVPENKLELYQKCFEYIANRREKEKSGVSYKWKEIGPIMKDSTFIELADLCFPNNAEISEETIKNKLVPIYTPKFGTEVAAENAIVQFLQFCSDRTELFVPATREYMFKFFHRSFFEYFYSQYIFTKCSSVNDIYDRLVMFDIDSEVFELTIAMFKQKSEDKYQQLIEFIFSKVTEEFNEDEGVSTAFNILTLGMQVIDDRLYIDNYIDLFVKYRNKFMNQVLYNENLIVRLLCRHNNSIQSIKEMGYHKAALETLIYLKYLVRRTKNKRRDENLGFSKKNIKIFFEFRMLELKRPDIYTKIFFITENISSWIINLDNTKLKEIKDIAQPSYQEWYGIKSTLNYFVQLEEEERKSLISSLELCINSF